MKSKNYKSGALRGKFFYFLGRNIIGDALLKSRDFKGERYKIGNEPFLLFANHADNLDPAYEIVTLRKYIRFVMSDHLTNNKFIRVFLKITASPIIKHHNESSDVLFEEIKNTARAGVSVGVHIEGEKTSTGETGYISKRNAVLAKECGCRLITYRLTGGYLKVPRWADEKRKGPIHGEIAHIYSVEEIKEMSVDELYECICKDLYVNAYEEQKVNPQKYIAENPAQSAEITLYGCPKCKKIGTLKSAGSCLSCECGFKAVIDDYGFWYGDSLPFDNITDWDKFQKNLLKELTDKYRGTEVELFSDSKQIIYTLENNEKNIKSSDADFRLFGDRLEIESEDYSDIIPIENIKRINIAGKSNLLLVTNNKYYDIRCNTPRSASKYVVAVRYLQGKECY